MLRQTIMLEFYITTLRNQNVWPGVCFFDMCVCMSWCMCYYMCVCMSWCMCCYICVRGCEDFTEEKRETGGYFSSVEATPHCSTRGLIQPATVTYIYLYIVN